MAASSLLSAVKGTIVVVASSYALQQKKKMPGTAAHVSTLTRPTSETVKNGQQFTLLKRITKLKFVNSDVVLLSTVSLEGFPRRAHTTLTEPA